MLTRKALIVHCVTSPPLRQSACSGRTVAQRKRGTDWRMTLNLHLAKRKCSSTFLKFEFVCVSDMIDSQSAPQRLKAVKNV